jgi:hypothetical protein
MAKYYNLGHMVVGTRGLLDAQPAAGETASQTQPEGRVLRQAILNTAYEPPGVHWFAVKNGYVYDPLGNDASRSAEQPVDTTDCGQRCIAYLLLCKRHGGQSVQL